MMQTYRKTEKQKYRKTENQPNIHTKRQKKTDKQTKSKKRWKIKDTGKKLHLIQEDDIIYEI